MKQTLGELFDHIHKVFAFMNLNAELELIGEDALEVRTALGNFEVYETDIIERNYFFIPTKTTWFILRSGYPNRDSGDNICADYTDVVHGIVQSLTERAIKASL